MTLIRRDPQISAAALHGGVHQELRHQLLLALDGIMQAASPMHTINLSHAALATGYAAAYSTHGLCSAAISHQAFNGVAPPAAASILPMQPALPPPAGAPLPAVERVPAGKNAPWSETLLVAPGALSRRSGHCTVARLHLTS